MIRSLHVIGSREMGGAERWFARFLRAMQRAGEPVEALVRKGGDLARHHLSGIPTGELPMRTVWDPLSRWEVSGYARRSQASVVQTYMGRATRLTHLKPGAGQVHVARLGGYYKIAQYRHAHAWVGNTRQLCDWLVQQGLPAQRVFHITNFAEPALPRDEARVAELRKELEVRPEDWIMLHPARFVWFKGHATLIDALARLPREVAGRRPRLVLLGEGGLRAQLEAQAQGLGVMDRIVWAGWQQDPAQWFHAADMVVFPSRDDEPLGNVILEAWAYAKPLVVTAFRGAREIARHQQDAWMTPCDDPAALAAGIEALVRDDDLRQRLVSEGSRRAVEDFGEAAIVDRYRELYRLLTRE
jgi:glycosyltransferase involved in cell wall biosynthesis